MYTDEEIEAIIEKALEEYSPINTGPITVVLGSCSCPALTVELCLMPGSGTMSEL